MTNLLNRLLNAFGPNAILCHLAAAQIKLLRARPKVTISVKQFTQATGRDPVDDDIDRVNCSFRGVGHDSCGWCIICNAPYSECGGKHNE